MPLTPAQRRRRRADHKNSARLSRVERSALLAGSVNALRTGDPLDELFRARLIAAELRADKSMQRVLDARRDAAADAGPGSLITEDVMTSRGNGGNGCLNSGQLRQPVRSDVGDVTRLLDDPRVARFSMR